MDCLDEETVVALLEGELGDEDVRAVEAHIDGCPDCRRVVSSLASEWRPPPSAPPISSPVPEIGAVLGGRFVLEEVAGSGGMGRVYRARDLLSGQKVAVKRVEIDEARFAREARLLADLVHPAIVRHVDDGACDDGTRYLAMEWLEGEDLARRLARGPLSVAETLVLGARIADALGAAHARGIVHRDVKPSNLFLPGGRVEDAKVVDFGVARSQAPGVTRTRTGALLGTPGYMAPEQARGDATIGPRADVFSLGCVLYECLTGYRTFPGENVIAVLSKLIMAPSPRPRARAPHVPRALDALVVRMLARDPAKRPRDGAEVAVELAALTSPSWRGSLRSLARPVSRGRLAGGIAVGVALVVGSAYVRSRFEAGPIAIAPVRAPRAIVDFPAPHGTRADAAAEYAVGLQALRDATLEQARAHLTRAVELEPGLAAAHLRLAVWADGILGPVESRRHFQAARALRATLSPRDRDFLDAVEPEILSEPPDQEETQRRMKLLPVNHPDDAELGLLAAGTGAVRSDVAEYDRVLALDPRYAYAWWGRASVQMGDGDARAALASLQRCVDIAPRSTLCRLLRTRIDAHVGDCVEMERDARAVIAVENGSDYGYLRLAHALFATGADREAVRVALTQRAASSTDAERARVAAFDAAEWAAGFGDFVTAEARAREVEKVMDKAPFEQDHVPSATLLVDVLEEHGDVAGAAAAADAFLKRRSAWRSLGARPFDDPRPVLLAAVARGGLRSREDVQGERDAWVSEWRDKLGPSGEMEIWVEGYARPARDARDVAEAVAARPAGQPLPSHPFSKSGWIWPMGFSLTGVGRVLVLAGQWDDAIAMLRPVTRNCSALNDAVAHEQAYLWLGRALDAKGDHDGACAAYHHVVRLWGDARPRSITAADARTRAASLACGPYEAGMRR